MLTDRDREILRQVAIHRYLHSRQIHSLVGGSLQHVLRRLQRLFHAGYLDRPRAQLRSFREAGSRPIIHVLTTRAVRILGASPSARHARSRVSELHIDHALLVADVLIRLEMHCRRSGEVQFQRLADGGWNQRNASISRWRASIRVPRESNRLWVIPDSVFVLRGLSGDKTLCALEADRGTMPLKRRSIRQTSLWRKLLAYESVCRAGRLADRYGCRRVRVLLLFESRDRAARAAALPAHLKGGRGLFAFADRAGFVAAIDPIGTPWVDCRSQPVSLTSSQRLPGKSYR